jgi:tetratricopeptide (TPR) repeat protein
MRCGVLAAAFVLSLAPLCAQRQKLSINAETPEGQLLQKASQESDDTQKLALLEEFLSKYPAHDGAGWAWSQAVPLYLKAQQFDKTVDGATKALAIDPSNAVVAYQALEACEQKKDYEGIKAWSAKTREAADKVLESQKPTDADELENWNRDVDYAKQVKTRADYSLYAAAVQCPDPKMTVSLCEALEKQNPSSEYLPQAAGRYFVALRQSGQEPKAVALAEKMLAKDQTNEDMLVVAASHYMDPKSKDDDKALGYATKLVDLMNTKPAPQGVPPADWDKKKDSLIGLGYWMQGMIYGGQSKWPQTDKSFRAALPHIQGNDLLAPAYFYIGLADFRMSEGPKGNKALLGDAKKFNQLCANIKSPYQAQAQKNIAAMAAAK